MAILNRAAVRTQAKDSVPSIRLGPWLLAAAVVVAVIAALQLYQTSKATTASYQMQGMEQQKVELETSVRQLEADVASLSSLTRIQQEAQRLGLQPAQARTSVQVNVPLPAERVRLPTRYAPQLNQAKVGGQQASWWHRLLKHLPFN
jgi:cell division protein FtsL